MTYDAIKHELHMRGTQALARLSHHVIRDISHVFNDQAELERYVAAVNICTRALTMVEQAKLDMQWRAVNVRDWVLILEYGSSAADLLVQGYWASLLATSVIRKFSRYHSPVHVDAMAALTLASMDGLSYLHQACLEQAVTSDMPVPVQASCVCTHLNMALDECKPVLRQLYDLNLVERVVDDDARGAVRQLVLTPEGAGLAKRLHFGCAQGVGDTTVLLAMSSTTPEAQHD